MFKTNRLALSLLALICLLYLGLAWRYATRTPDWQVPDEPAHYNYVRQLSTTGEIPVIEAGDWNQAYLDSLRANKFASNLLGDLDTVQYEDHQPPLYYLLQSGVYQATDGDLEIMRFFSAVLGLGVIIGVWLIGQTLFPDKPWLGVAGAAFVAFIPQHVAMLAGLNNDALAETFCALVLWLVVLIILHPDPQPRLFLGMGILVGLIFLTKTTVYYVSGVAGLAVLAKWRLAHWSGRELLARLALFVLPALALGMLWWVHSVDVYGGTDFLGLQRHDEVVVGQPRTDDFIEDVYGGSEQVYWENLTQTVFNSFWGQFGWMGVPMPPNIYRLIKISLVFIAVGLAIYLAFSQWRRWQAPHYALLALMALSLALVGAQFLIYNRTFVQFQGRYLYPALVPMALLVGLGCSGWAERLGRINRGLAWLAIIPPFILAFLTWYALNSYIVPNL